MLQKIVSNMNIPGLDLAAADDDDDGGGYINPSSLASFSS